MDMTPTGDSGSEHPPLAHEMPDPEVHILGSIMVNPAMLDYVESRIKPEHFQSELHRRIYRSMLYKHSYGIPPSLQCLSLEARPSGLLENVGQNTLLEMARRIATTAHVADSVESIVERYKRQELDGPQMQGRDVLEKQGSVSPIIETFPADLDDLERRHATLASQDTDGSQLSRLNTEPRPTLVCTMPLLAVDTRPQRRPPRGAAEFGSFARLGNRVAKPLALVTLIVGAGAAAWFAGRWSARVAPPPRHVYAAAPMQDHAAQVASEVQSSAAKAANAEKMALQQTTTAPAVVPSAGRAPQVSQPVIQSSTPAAPQVAPPSKPMRAAAPMRDQAAQVASEVLATVSKAANAEEVAPQQATIAPAVVPSAGEAPQVPQVVIQTSTPVAPQDDATPRVRAPAPRREGGLIYAVNVSSFRNAAGAAAEVAKLQARGYQARAIRTDLESKGVWYRVYVGQYATEAEANQARAEFLKQTNYGTAHVRSIALDHDISALGRRR